MVEGLDSNAIDHTKNEANSRLVGMWLEAMAGVIVVSVRQAGVQLRRLQCSFFAYLVEVKLSNWRSDPKLRSYIGLDRDPELMNHAENEVDAGLMAEKQRWVWPRKGPSSDPVTHPKRTRLTRSCRMPRRTLARLRHIIQVLHSCAAPKHHLEVIKGSQETALFLVPCVAILWLAVWCSTNELPL